MIRHFWNEFLERSERVFEVLAVVFDSAWRAVWHFVCNWIISRPYRELLWGLPVVVLALSVALLLWTSQKTAAELALHYRQSAALAQLSDDGPAADLWLSKVVLLTPGEPSHLFRLALLAEQRGQAERARRIMRCLAPESTQGYAEAHLWVANDLARTEVPLTLLRRRSLEHHLRGALHGPRRSAEAQRMLGLLLFSNRRYEQALPHLLAAADYRPDVRLRLGQVYAALEQPQRAAIEWKKALRSYRRIVDEHPADHDARLYLAECNILLGRLDDAELVLSDANASHDARIARKRLTVYLTKFDHGWQQDRAQPEAALDLLLAADQLLPNVPEVLNRMALLAERDRQARQQIRRLLQIKVAQGDSPASVRFVLGVIAAVEGQFETATFHYELALAQQPPTMALMNNLAWSLANSARPDLGRALRLAEEAMQLAPEHPRVLDTRGQILAMHGHWSESITDLEKALPFLSDRAPVHDVLGLAYDNVDLPDVAQIHRHRAAAWRSAASSVER